MMSVFEKHAVTSEITRDHFESFVLNDMDFLYIPANMSLKRPETILIKGEIYFISS